MSANRKVKFVASDPARGGLPVKRKQVQHACAACRRKKRRCIHAEDSVEDDQNQGFDSPPHSTSPVQNRPAQSANSNGMRSSLPPYSYAGTPVTTPVVSKPAPAHTPTPAQAEASRPQSSRFVGDLNPEGIFMEAAGPDSARQASQQGDVGIWLSPASGSGQPPHLITSRPPPIMDGFLLPFVREHCLSCLPPEEDFLRLKDLYLRKIHPIFPVIPEASLNENIGSPVTVVLRQLVCLAAVTDPEVRQQLRLQNRGSEPLTPQDFSQAVSSSVRAILETSLIPDRVLHIRALTMLSLYTQPTCAEEADLPAQLGGRAVHHIQTLGLHLLRYDGPNSDELESVFCAVWALDRMNAAVYGRPCLIHERDIGANLDACIKRRPPCFRLLLSVVQWLDQVIELYRPGPSAEVSGLEKIAYIDLPVLEAMIVNADALRVPSFLLATVETFYHAVIILSCRLPRPGTVPAASTLPPPSANARRSLAAERIAFAVQRDSLSSLPFIPYAVSLALSVEYRKMRHSRLPMFRARAMNSFRRNCEMLRDFGEYFWSASVVAGLSGRVLKEMERAANTLAREVTPSSTDGVSRSATQSGSATQEPQPSEMPPNFSQPGTSGGRVDNMVDFSLIDAISGQDVFGHIDPTFNLNAVEDALEANLDIGLPLNWASILLITLAAVLGSRPSQKATPSLRDGAEADDRDTSIDGPKATNKLKIHSRSRLATANAEMPNASIRTLIFQNVDETLVAMEWHNGELEMYNLRQRIEAAVPSTPAPGSPLYLFYSGPQNDLHLTYVNKTRHIVHLTQRAAQTLPRRWAVGSLSPGKDQKLRPMTKDMRMSAAVLRRSSSPDSDGLILLYQTDARDPTFTILTISDLSMNEWSSSTLTASTVADMPMRKDSPGLLIVPSRDARQLLRREELQRMWLRLFWDHADKDGAATLGVADCQVGKGASKKRPCVGGTAHWAEEKHKKILLNARKPLRISTMAMKNPQAAPRKEQYVVQVLDADGDFLEILWDGNEWADLQTFSADSKTSYRFSSVAATEPDALFGISEGKLLQFDRLYPWWSKSSRESADWHKVGEVKPP
ncbi:hypothetical protein HJFPF1_12568 [Paramyrothecium foliicola]|nr:hypothetical protein HJFPF1_12568 [Paramyrothecium foliicola]